MLNIIEQTYDWKWIPEKRRSTDTIVLHHSAGTGSVEDVHRIHRGQGWPGIGYHFYVRRNGEVYRGRPEEQIGTHTAHYNASTIGVCFEGNFEQEKMPDAQYNAGVELVRYLLDKYGALKIKRHRDFNATACPGQNFPYDEMKEEASMQRYNTLKEMPDWAKPTVQKLMDKKVLVGSGAKKDPQGYPADLDLSLDMLKLLCINDRAGVYK